MLAKNSHISPDDFKAIIIDFAVTLKIEDFDWEWKYDRWLKEFLVRWPFMWNILYPEKNPAKLDFKTEMARLVAEHKEMTKPPPKTDTKKSSHVLFASQDDAGRITLTKKSRDPKVICKIFQIIFAKVFRFIFLI